MYRTFALSEPTTGIAEEIRTGLTKLDQKELPCSYLYDEVGSALFEAIAALPEYGLSRAGERLMRNHSDDVVRLMQMPLMVAELGSGSGRRTKPLLEALSAQQWTPYCPIEISSTSLVQCRNEFSSNPRIMVLGFEQEYLDGLTEAVRLRRPGMSVLALFLGSTIGNFQREEGFAFIADLRNLLQKGDSLLLATDLMKPVSRVLPAYDDPIGVTSAFNLNMLARLNREFGADFCLRNFRHEARWNDNDRRVEMHLRSLRNQMVSLPGLDLEISLREEETIWTESSHKYWPDEVIRMARTAGFQCLAQWIDEEWPFAHTLFQIR